MSRLRADERGLVGKAIVVILVIVLAGGIGIVDGASIIFTRLRVSDIASRAALNASATYARTKNLGRARTAALAAAREREPDIRLCALTDQRMRHCDMRVQVNVLTSEATVTVKKVASTLVVRRVGFLEDFGRVSDTQSAKPPG